MKRIALSFFLFSILWSPQLGAEDNKPVIRLMPFFIEGLGPVEARFISTLIESYVTDIGDVISEVDTSFEVPSDFILSGTITVEQDNRVLTLKIVKSATGETAYHISTHKTTSDLTLKARSLVEAAFSVGFEEAFKDVISQEILTEQKILGTWRGDAGLEIVRLQPGGTGIAILSSGAQMRMDYTIENNSLKLIQVSPNRARFYHPLPFDVARELSVQAEPWQYEFFLSADGTVLRGLKTFTDARYEDNRVLELLPNSVREAEWTKLSR
jgi:hypothetical protein